MHDKIFKDKEKYDLYSKRVKDKRDNILYSSGCKRQNVKGLIFVFKEKDFNDKGIEDLGIWAKDDTNWNKNNFVILMHYD